MVGIDFTTLQLLFVLAIFTLGAGLGAAVAQIVRVRRAQRHGETLALAHHSDEKRKAAS